MGERKSKLYKLINGLGTYWVIAKDPTDAEVKLMNILNAGEGDGFYGKRKVIEIHLIAEEIHEPPFGLTGTFLAI